MGTIGPNFLAKVRNVLQKKSHNNKVFIISTSLITLADAVKINVVGVGQRNFPAATYPHSSMPPSPRFGKPLLRCWYDEKMFVLMVFAVLDSVEILLKKHFLSNFFAQNT